MIFEEPVLPLNWEENMEYQMKDLVFECKKGDSIAKEEILERLKPLILASIKKYYYGNEDIQDLLQEGYVKVLIEINKFDTNRGIPFLGYIKLQLKYFYMEKGKADCLIDSKIHNSVIDKEVSLMDIIPGDEDIEEKILKSEKFNILEQAIRALTYRQKQIINLYYIKGLKMPIIAKRLKISYYTVAKTKERAIKNLKEKYNKIYLKPPSI